MGFNLNLEWLKMIISDDNLGLLKIKPKNFPQNADDNLIAKFNEINNFIDSQGREPREDILSPTEYMLHQSLSVIRQDVEQCESLKGMDVYNLLAIDIIIHKIESNLDVKEKKELNSFEDIFADDEFGLLDVEKDTIFELRHIPNKPNKPDKIAQRQKCSDFEKYEPIFKNCYMDLKSGESEAHKFTGEQQIQKGNFFILNGIMCYVSNIGPRERVNGKVNARLQLIFENGTSSNMLLRSLATELYKDANGRRILLKSERALETSIVIEDGDAATGYIYIVQSLSTKPQIMCINDLYKIGYTSMPIESRTANSENEPTYLMAPVKLIAGYQCYNMNSHKFETLIHNFFGEACLEIEVADSQGRICKPREWFIAPLNAIELSIELLINGDIINYKYDTYLKEVVPR
jgi:hypothetical protein